MPVNFKTPTLLLDQQKCLTNYKRMMAKADQHNLIFRPHFKTHQSVEVGRWFREMGLQKITVSSVSMARYFAHDGWNDITIAFPLNPAEASDIQNLAQAIDLNVMVENHEGVDALARGLTDDIGVFIKIDAGYHRTGIEAENYSAILELVQEVAKYPFMEFRGFIIHNGHTYHASGRSEIQDIHQQSQEKIAALKTKMTSEGIEALYSLGDTPALSQVDDFENIDEIRPGNFVFYDVMQQSLGACDFKDIAVAMACPVVAKHPLRNQLVIYGGAVHLAKDYVLDQEGKKSYGKVVELNKNGWGDPVPDTSVVSLSQEHGIIQASDDFMNQVNIGDFISILPIHSCLTVSAMREMITLDGEKLTTLNC